MFGVPKSQRSLPDVEHVCNAQPPFHRTPERALRLSERLAVYGSERMGGLPPAVFGQTHNSAQMP